MLQDLFFWFNINYKGEDVNMESSKVRILLFEFVVFQYLFAFIDYSVRVKKGAFNFRIQFLI